MLDFFQKGGNTQWFIAIAIAIVVYIIYRRNKDNQTT